MVTDRVSQEVMDWLLRGIFGSTVTNQPSTTQSVAAMNFIR
jgi:hypothetical protein